MRQSAVGMSGCASMLVWLGKRWLGQKRQDHTNRPKSLIKGAKAEIATL